MHQHLLFRTEIPDQAVRVKISAQEHQLEKQQRRAPHRRRAAEPGQDEFRDQRLDLKEQERAQKDRNGVDEHRSPRIAFNAAKRQMKSC